MLVNVLQRADWDAVCSTCWFSWCKCSLCFQLLMEGHCTELGILNWFKQTTKKSRGSLWAVHKLATLPQPSRWQAWPAGLYFSDGRFEPTGTMFPLSSTFQMFLWRRKGSKEVSQSPFLFHSSIEHTLSVWSPPSWGLPTHTLYLVFSELQVLEFGET